MQNGLVSFSQSVVPTMHPHPRPCTSRFSTDIYSTRPPATTQQTLGDTCRTCGVTLVPWNAIGRLPGEDTLLLKNSAMNKQALLNFCVSFIWSMHIYICIYIYRYIYIDMHIDICIFIYFFKYTHTYLHTKCQCVVHISITNEVFESGIY